MMLVEGHALLIAALRKSTCLGDWEHAHSENRSRASLLERGERRGERK